MSDKFEAKEEVYLDETVRNNSVNLNKNLDAK